MKEYENSLFEISQVPNRYDSNTATGIQSPNLCTLKEIAKYLRVSEKTIYYWAKRREIPFVRVGRHLRFIVDDVLKFFSKKTHETNSPCFHHQFLIKERESWSLKTRVRGLASGNGGRNGNH